MRTTSIPLPERPVFNLLTITSFASVAPIATLIALPPAGVKVSVIAAVVFVDTVPASKLYLPVLVSRSRQ